MAFSDHFLQIQSAYKGFKARKEINEKTKLSQSVKPPQKPAPKKVEETKETPKETSYSFFGRFMSSGRSYVRHYLKSRWICFLFLYDKKI